MNVHQSFITFFASRVAAAGHTSGAAGPVLLGFAQQRVKLDGESSDCRPYFHLLVEIRGKLEFESASARMLSAASDPMSWQNSSKRFFCSW